LPPLPPKASSAKQRASASHVGCGYPLASPSGTFLNTGPCDGLYWCDLYCSDGTVGRYRPSLVASKDPDQSAFESSYGASDHGGSVIASTRPSLPSSRHSTISGMFIVETMSTRAEAAGSLVRRCAPRRPRRHATTSPGWSCRTPPEGGASGTLNNRDPIWKRVVRLRAEQVGVPAHDRHPALPASHEQVARRAAAGNRRGSDSLVSHGRRSRSDQGQFLQSTIRRRCRLRRRRPLRLGLKQGADRNHHGLRSRSDFDRRWAVQGSNLRPWD
jgi:hypothetical protein